jgi:alpha-1,2-mannosyltransferase
MMEKPCDTRYIRLTVGFIAVGFLLMVGLQIGALRSKPGDTELEPPAWYFTLRQGGDSWRPMERAYNFLVPPRPWAERSFYQKLFFSPANRHKGYQYPPTALLTVAALHPLVGADFPTALRVLTWFCVPMGTLLVYGILRRGAGCAGAPADAGRRRWLAVLAVIATLTFFPFMVSYRAGQIQTWINVLFAAAVLACWHGRPIVGGALIGVASLIKPQLGLLGLWALLSAEWAFLGALAATVALGVGLSIALFGWGPHVEYLEVLRYIAARGETFFPNQSVNGLMNRLLHNGDSAVWMEHFPEANATVFAATTLSSALLIAGGLLAARRRGAGLAGFALMGLTATMASPIAWDHHYGVLLPVFAYLFTALRARPPFGRATQALLAICYFLSSHCFYVARRLEHSAWGFTQSYLLLGAIMAYVLLLGVIWRTPTEGPFSARLTNVDHPS